MSSKPLWSAQRVTSPVPGVGIGTPYGALPKDRTYWQARKHHTGDDYPAGQGAPAVAVLDGAITLLPWDSVLGNVVLLLADDGATYWYCHLSARSANGPVKAGDVVGEVGQTGSGARGPHLHFEKRAGHSRSWSGPDLLPRW